MLPWQHRLVSTQAEGAEVLHLAQVGQDGAGRTVHAVEGVARVQLPPDPQELDTQTMYSLVYKDASSRTCTARFTNVYLEEHVLLGLQGFACIKQAVRSR